MFQSIEKTNKSTKSKPSFSGKNEEKHQQKKQQKLLAEKRKAKREWD